MTETSTTASGIGVVVCEECQARNPFRSDFTYQVGMWVLGHRCAVCGGSPGGQRVVALHASLEAARRDCLKPPKVSP